MLHACTCWRWGSLGRHALTFALQPFRLWLGVTEYLFRQPQLLDEVINTAIEDNTFRADDLEFTFAARVSTIFSHHPRRHEAKGRMMPHGADGVLTYATCFF